MALADLLNLSPWPVGWLIAAALVVDVVIVVYLAISILMCRPWDPSFRQHSEELSMIPYPIFAFGTKIVRLAELYLQTKPAPLRLAEVTVAYMQSQVLFVVMNLGIAEQLQKGPKTPYELAAAAGPHVNPDWLARVLKLAAEMGLVKRTKRPDLPISPTSSGADSPALAAATASALSDLTHCGGSDDLSKQQDQNRGSAADRESLAAIVVPTSGCNDLYHPTGVSALLCREHPNCMTDFVKLFENHYAAFTYLSEGIKAGKTPFSLWSGGPNIWQHMRDDPVYGAIFDGAMRATNHTGAKMAVEQYNWGRYDVVVDIGGGNGQFLTELLTKHPKLQGVVVDFKGQVTRGQEWWEEEFQHLLPRMQFKEGSMFDSTTLPSPRPGKKTLYVLKQILHGFSDADTLSALKSIRAVISDEDVAAGRASLAVLETGTVETINRDLLQHRLMADLTMLMAAGDGKERDEHQTRVLLDAAGFKLHRMVGTTGLMIVMEAKPVPLPAAGRKAAANGAAKNKGQ